MKFEIGTRIIVKADFFAEYIGKEDRTGTIYDIVHGRSCEYSVRLDDQSVALGCIAVEESEIVEDGDEEHRGYEDMADAYDR